MARDNNPIDPEHYTRNGIKAADVADAWELAYWDGLVVKYVLRAKYKADEIEDLKKAQWCLTRHIANVARRNGGGISI